MKKIKGEFIMGECEAQSIYEICLDQIVWGNEAVVSSARSYLRDYIQASHWCYRKRLREQVESLENERKRSHVKGA